MEAKTSHTDIGLRSTDIHISSNTVSSIGDIASLRENDSVSRIIMPIARIENSIESLARGAGEQSSMNLRDTDITEEREWIPSNTTEEVSMRYPVESCTPNVKDNSLTDDITSATPEILKLTYSSMHISRELRLAGIDKYYEENIALNKISASNIKGIFKDEHGKFYLEISGKYVKTEKITNGIFYISHPDRYFLIELNADQQFVFFKKHVKNVPLRLFYFCNASTLGIHGSYLDKVNKKRAEIFNYTLEKTSLIINHIAKTAMKMSEPDIVKDIKSNLRIALVIEDAIKIKKHILDLPKAIDAFLKNRDKFFFISKPDGLSFISGGYNSINSLIIITDDFFTTDTFFAITTLLHELSHVTGALDIFYLNRHNQNKHQRRNFFRFSFLTVSEKENLRKNVAELKYQLITKIAHPDKVIFQPGHDYRPDITNEIRKTDILNKDNFHALVANNADTVMLYALHLFDRYSKNKQFLSTEKNTIKHLLNSEDNQKTFISTLLNMPATETSS